TGREEPREAGREGKTRGVPLLVVGVGDPSRPRNLRVDSLYVRPQVWQHEPFEIDAVLSAQGVADEEVHLELVEERLGAGDQAASNPTVVQSLRLPIPAGGGRLQAQFSHTPTAAGRYVYSVRAEQLADELEQSDNQLAGPVVKVLNRERIRVLLVAGGPTWDYQLVQKLLARDKTIAVSCWLQ